MASADERFTLTAAGTGSELLVPSLVMTVTPPEGDPVERRLDLRPVLIGTSPECTVVVADARLSRRHCELRLTDQGILLRDLGSKNGTFVGEVRVREALIPPGSTVSLGGSRLVVRAAGAPSLVPLLAGASFGGAVGQSLLMRALFARLSRAAATDETILLLGEMGTGKEVLARAVHDQSARRAGPFVVFDCGAAAPSLVEAELFGYVKGAFTGADQTRPGLLESANGGTVFLDEIGELPLELQPKLLRALETRQVRRLGSTEQRPFDARFVAATHRDLKARAAEGGFRPDLYYRIAVVEMAIPALRERKEDIPALVELFLAARRPPRSLADLPPHAMALLSAHDWPGNVRELRNMVARLVLFPEAVDELLAPKKRAPAAGAPPAPAADPSSPAELAAPFDLPLPAARELVLEQFERRYFAAKLEQHQGNVSRAAEAMGVSRQLVHRHLARYGIKTR
ncbi:MAG: sigma 54-interacting transcriptional regulator [Byssovorax sp.]